jgi:hypothetical protein
MNDYHDSTDLNEQRCKRINHALVKFFIACGIAFRIVEHPFFINFIKELNAGYNYSCRPKLFPNSETNSGQKIFSEILPKCRNSSEILIGPLPKL